MAAFKFRLQSILDFRSGLVDRVRLEVNTLHVRLYRAMEVREELRADLHATLAAQNALQAAGPLDIAELTRLMAGAESIEAHIAEQDLVIEGCRRDIDDATARLVELSKEAKALEKLREHQQVEHLQDDTRRERAETSELASLRHRSMQVARTQVVR